MTFIFGLPAHTIARMTSTNQPDQRRPRFSALTAAEIAKIATALQPLVGAQIQDCLQTTSEIGLAFYHERKTLWLWFDLNPMRPLVVRVQDKAPNRKKISRPLTLFIRSHLLGRRLQSVIADLTRGRLLVFSFHRAADEEIQGPCEIEVRLFPHGQNVIAKNGQKSVAENKPKELHATDDSFAIEDSTTRSWEEIEEYWWNTQKAKPSGVAAKADDAAVIERDWRRAIEKKEKALERMNEELLNKTSNSFSEIGEWLKIHRTLDVRPEWASFINSQKSLSWNIDECFRKAKENIRKSSGTRERLKLVETELEKLRASGPAGFMKGREKAQQVGAQNLLSRAEAKGRRHQVADDLDVYIGKSAADNLSLLRRAQSFDYWLHLRDQPGSHAILKRTRTRQVTDAEFIEAGRWLIEQSLGKRVQELKGESHDMLIVECRFVRPIKGDKLGRVNYSNDRVLRLKF